MKSPVAPELLSPAGDMEALRAAVANGADAVYFGLSQFNARHRAENFSSQSLPEVLAYLHDHNVRGYVAFNTLIFSDELEEAARHIAALCAAAADAVIVQDLGLAHLMATMAPALEVHGSTQMTLSDERGIELVRQLGVKRVILARELSMDQVARIAAATTMPVEVFVHGALCVAYSGQCLTSEALGGRSANRGQCAQACRLPYELVVDGETRDLGEVAYLLSPQDLAAVDCVGRLAEMGVASVKIEGRLKSAEYVAATTAAYRAALDAAQRGQRFELTAKQRVELEQSFSRGFTHGFLDGVDHQKLVQGRFPKSRGVRVGVVTRVLEWAVAVRVENNAVELKPGDGVVFDQGHPEQDEQGGRIYAVEKRSGDLLLRFGKGAVNGGALEPGAIVWKTDDPALRRRLEQSYSREVVPRRRPIDLNLRVVVSEPLTATLSVDGVSVQASTPEPLAAAIKHPLAEPVVREQFGRLGDTPFELGQVTLHGRTAADAPEPAMAPKSVLNELRRRVVELLEQRLREGRRIEVTEPAALGRLREEARRLSQELAAATPADAAAPADATPRMLVLCRDLEQVRAVAAWSPAAPMHRPMMLYCELEDPRRYGEAVSIARTSGLPIALATTRIHKTGEDGLLRQVMQQRPDALLVRHLAAIDLCRREAPELPMVGDYSLNVANELTAGVLLRLGVRRLTPSYDLNWPQMRGLAAALDPRVLELVLHQHMPMFHMEHCVFAHLMSQGKDYRDCGRPCDNHRVELRDRVGQPHRLMADVGCRNTLYNGQAQSGLEYLPRMLELGLRQFRVELLGEDAGQSVALLERYAAVLAGAEPPANALRSLSSGRGLRVLNQLGVTRGTLAHA